MTNHIIPEMEIQITIRSPHRSGELGKILTKIGKLGGLVGDISTKMIGKTHSIRDIIVCVFDQDHLKNILKKIQTSEVSILSQFDLVYERHKQGKIHTGRRRNIDTLADMRYIYTPGVARVCKSIHEDASKAKEYTSIGNSVGIFTNGTRVLGLGDIGPVASMPVMEGKAMIYDQFVGISATPILINTKDPKEFVNTVVKVAPSFGGIHLEDIRVPDCFYIEDELKKKLLKPVMHDDQHGTGTVTLAATMTTLRLTENNSKKNIVVAQIGLGAAGFGVASLLHDWGVEVIGVDTNKNAQNRFIRYGGKVSTLTDAMKKADIVVTSTGVVGLIKPNMIRKNQIILALSNPTPEISPEEAIASGAGFAADGKTINNALAYPGLFKAALHMQIPTIDSDMKIRAAEVISSYAEDNELVPNPLNNEIHQKIVEEICKLKKGS